MRLIGIGLLAFLLAGLALLLARSEMVSHTMRAIATLTDGPQLRFETPIAAQAPSGAEQAIITRAGPAAPLILSGLPAYQGAVFHMPIDARPTSGYLQIDATSQVLDGVEGVLRISIDNTRRAEVLLHPGEAVRSVRIELTSADIARAQLVVSFSLQGTVANPVCTSDHAVEAVVEIETTSALFVALDGPLASPRDRIAAWGDQLRIEWDGQARSLWRAVEARRAEASALFVPMDGLSGEDADHALADLAAHRPAAPQLGFAWSHAMDPDGNLYGLRRFQRSQIWRLPYDARHARSALMPEALELALFLAPHPMGAEWQVSVTLDGRHLAHYVLAATTSTLRDRIAIPAQSGAAHTIEITVTSNFLPEGLCNDGPELLAEILPETRMVASTQMTDDPLTSLIAAMAARPQASLTPAPGLNAAEASVAADLLYSITPHAAAMSGEGPTIHVLPRGAVFDIDPSGTSWLVYREGADNAIMVVPAATHARQGTRGVALLIHVLEAAT